MAFTDSPPFSIAISNPLPPGWGSQTDNTWVQVSTNTPNAIKPTQNNVGGAWDSTNFGNIMARWSGGAFDPVLLRHYFIGGGHGDYRGNEHFMFDHLNPAQAFQLLRNPSNDAGGDESVNGAGNYSDGQPRGMHTYNNPISAGNRLWLTATTAMSGGNGNTSTAIWSWAHGETNWMSHGKGIATAPGGSWTYIEACAAYDALRRKVYVMAPVASAGKSYYSILVDPPYTRTEFNQGFDMGQYSWATAIPGSDIIVAGSTLAGNFWYLNCANPTAGFNGLNYSGTPRMLSDFPTGGHYAGHYHAGHNRIYGWEAVDGKNISYLSVPGNPITGTYVPGSLVSAGTSATPAVTGGTTNGSDGVFGKFQIFQAADGRYGASLALNTNAPLWRYKFSVAAA